MSEHTIFLKPSEAFLLGMVLGEWQKYRDYVTGLHDIHRDVCTHMYKRLPTFYNVLESRLEPFVGQTGYIEWYKIAPPSDIAWLPVTDEWQLGCSLEHPWAILERHKGQDLPNNHVAGRRLDTNREKSLFYQLLYLLRGFVGIPYNIAILMEVAASNRLSSDWSHVYNLFSTGQLVTEIPPKNDVQKLIEAKLAPSLEGYDAEVEAGRCAGRLLAAIELDRRELPGDAECWVNTIQAGLDRWADDRRIVEIFTRDQLAEFWRLVQVGTPEALQVIRDQPEPRPHLDGERPPIILGGKIPAAASALLEHAVVRACPHAISVLERSSTFDELLAEIVWYDRWNAEELGLDWDDDWICGAYDDPAGQIIDADGGYIRKTLAKHEIQAWTAIGALLGDMAERDRAFSEEDAKKVIPRNLTSFEIDDIGNLRDFLPTARKLLALGPSARGGDEAAVVKTLVTSLEPIMESTFPAKFPVREGQVVSVLQEVIRESNGDERLLASHLLHLWRNYRNEAAHHGSERRYSHSEARAVYSLYELAIELHDRIVESRE